MSNSRRRLELSHPELFPTSTEIDNRRQLFTYTFGICKSICIFIMVLITIIIIILAREYKSSGIYITFFGTIANIIIGMLVAYNLGNKISRSIT